MLINADFNERAVLLPQDQEWLPSPAPGVERKMLYREGDEVAIATSVVRYAPGSAFAPHSHDAGEEFLVLDGTFSDETGDFTKGTYVRNPPGSSHAPFTKDGTTIFVSLRQFDMSDSQHVVIDTNTAEWRPGLTDGLSVLPLHQFGTVQTAMVRWAPGTQFTTHTHFGGEEIFVIDGVFEDELGAYPAGTWLRNPHGSKHAPWSTEGATIFVRVGHLG